MQGARRKERKPTAPPSCADLAILEPTNLEEMNQSDQIIATPSTIISCAVHWLNQFSIIL
jgi:hypothetical protein